MEECIFMHIALSIECRFNKNTLLRCYFLAFLLAGMYHCGYLKITVFHPYREEETHLYITIVHQFGLFFVFVQRDHERMKATKEREEKLIISAWYELVRSLVIVKKTVWRSVFLCIQHCFLSANSTTKLTPPELL